jgi:hypothetical protein
MWIPLLGILPLLQNLPLQGILPLLLKLPLTHGEAGSESESCGWILEAASEDLD